MSIVFRGGACIRVADRSRSTCPSPGSIEDEPEFAKLLAFLARDATAHPDRLVEPDDVLTGIDELLEGVEPL